MKMAMKKWRAFFSHSKIENEIDKKYNKYLNFLKLTDEKDLWIGFIEFLSQFPLFWFFPFSCYLLNKRNYAMTRKEEKSKQWIFWNKLKTQLTIFRLRFSQRIFNHFLVNKVLPVLIFFLWFEIKIV